MDASNSIRTASNTTLSFGTHLLLCAAIGLLLYTYYIYIHIYSIVIWKVQC